MIYPSFSLYDLSSPSSASSSSSRLYPIFLSSSLFLSSVIACWQEAYMVPPDKKATKVPPEQLSSALFSVNSALRRPPRHTHKTPRLTPRLSRPPPLSPPPYPPRHTPFQVLKQNKKPNQLRPTRTPAGLAKINSSGLETLTRLIY